MAKSLINVVYYQRRPQGANHSIERFFSDIRHGLPDNINAKTVICRFPSRGFCKRLYNIIEAVFYQGNINHITGDVYYIAIFLRKKKTILTILDHVCLRRLKGWRKLILFVFWYWLPIKRSALVTVISKFTKNELSQYIKIDQSMVRVVYCAVSDDYQPVAKIFNTVRPVILQVGTGLNKNVERVAQSLHKISCHLRVIGGLTENQLKVLQKYGVDYSNVFNISDAEVVDEYSRCDMLVFASTYEGFGLPIVEANATGRPVVTSNLCSMPEVAGDAACIINPFNIVCIREGILKIINDPIYRENLIQKGYENAKRFRAKKIAHEYADIYNEIMSR